MSEFPLGNLSNPIPIGLGQKLNGRLTETDGDLVYFSKTKLLRDILGSPIPQIWDHENKQWVPVTLQMVHFMAKS